MRLPYFFWNLKYNTVSFPLEEAAEELQHELTCLTAVKNNIMEIVKSYSLTKEHAVKYKNDSDKLVVYLDKNLWSIEFIDNDTIMVINGSGGLSSKTKYVRTTHEEAESINEKNNEPRKTSGRIW